VSTRASAPFAGSSTSPLPGKLDVAAENAISVPPFGAQLPPLWRPHLPSLRELSAAAAFIFRFILDQDNVPAQRNLPHAGRGTRTSQCSAAIITAIIISVFIYGTKKGTVLQGHKTVPMNTGS
jgi:hypothetical protein